MERYESNRTAIEALKQSIVVERWEPGVVLCGCRYLNGDEVCSLLGVDSRKLKAYRDNRELGYSNLGGNILYREEDVNSLIEKYYIGSCN